MVELLFERNGYFVKVSLFEDATDDPTDKLKEHVAFEVGKLLESVDGEELDGE